MSKNSSLPPKRPSKSSRKPHDFVSLLEQGAKPLIGDEETVVLAVSGGADSMAMLHGWMESNLPTPVVAHFNHQLRADSSEDARFVAETAGRLGLPFEVGEWTEKPSGRIGEKAARDARYDFLFNVAKKVGSKSIAIAHTRDDQAETVLFRLLRGTGVDGLSGMSTVRQLREGIALVRPLLGVHRKSVREFIENHGFPFREDPSNTDLSRARNRIRRELIPLLAEQHNPTIVDALARIADSAVDNRLIIGKHVDSLWETIPMQRSPHEVVVPKKSLENLLSTERTLLVRLLFARQRWPMGRMTAQAWRKLAAVASDDGPVGWQGPDGITAMRTESSFIVRRKG